MHKSEYTSGTYKTKYISVHWAQFTINYETTGGFSNSCSSPIRKEGIMLTTQELEIDWLIYNSATQYLYTVQR
jgi:hypothetical protein